MVEVDWFVVLKNSNSIEIKFTSEGQRYLNNIDIPLYFWLMINDIYLTIFELPRFIIFPILKTEWDVTANVNVT